MHYLTKLFSSLKKRPRKSKKKAEEFQVTIDKGNVSVKYYYADNRRNADMEIGVL